ncbi:MAG TPA: hypothetical protein ENO05_11450 [Bacteroides sp.]|nr:hypothetical protein [Bacteroides sp.]
MRSTLLVASALVILGAGCNPEKERTVLFDPGKGGTDLVVSLTADSIISEGGMIRVNFNDRLVTPVVAVYPREGSWDGSGYRFVRCEIGNPGNAPQVAELGFGDYDLTLGAAIVPPGGTKILKAVIYRTDHPPYIDSLFPVMHGKPDGTLRSWMASACDSIAYIRLLFPEKEAGTAVRIGRIWLEAPYVLYSEEELRERFFPFVDRYGQYLYDEWPLKIRSPEDILTYDSMETEELRGMEPPAEWDRYGGWVNGPRLEATGRFRVEKVDGKWWFIDPEGNLFWSHGMDCVEFGTQTRTRITGREQLFRWLPDPESPEGNLYMEQVNQGDTTRYLSFHALNIFRKYGEGWKEKSNERIHTRFRHWGMNTIGNWSDPHIYLQRKTPYVLTAYSMKTGLIADPYAPGFREDLEHSLKSRTEEVGDPWCLGVFVDNELKWGVKWAPKIPEQILTAPPGQPAKKILMQRMKERYTSVSALNSAWKTSFAGWEDFLENSVVIPGATTDMREFMKEFASRYYSICREAVKAVDPDMLYLGCRMDFHLYPEDTSLNYIIRIASQYCDVVSFNRYRYTCSELVPPDGGDYPLIIGEFHFGSLETGLLQPGLRYAADQDERAAFYHHYVKSALRNPYLVGTHWFQLADQAVTGRPDGENYQAGFLTVGDVPQPEIVAVSRSLGNSMYGIRSGN